MLLCFLQMTEDMEKTHESFLQGAQQELKKEMNTLQKKVLMEMVSEVSEKSWTRGSVTYIAAH